MTISDNDSKKRRGRPRLLEPDHLTAYRAIMGEELSDRTMQNRHYVSRASVTLDLHETPADHPYRYLIDPDRMKGVRFTILAELGRMTNPDDMRFVADHICSNRLPTAAAVALIRRVRLGGQPPPPDRLVDVLLAAINAHLSRYPGDHARVLPALHEVTEIVESQAPADDKSD